MSAGDNIGMMEGAFFVSKGVILEWLNELLDVRINYILKSTKFREFISYFISYLNLIKKCFKILISFTLVTIRQN